MKRPNPGKRPSAARTRVAAKSMSRATTKRASIFINGRNQAVRLPQDLRFPPNVKEVRIRKEGDGLFLLPVRPDWKSFFELPAQVPDDLIEDRNDRPPQKREPL